METRVSVQRDNDQSRVLDLRLNGTGWDYPSSSLPDEITSPSGETLHAVDLPNASLNADALLCDSIAAVVGVTVRISDEDLPGIKALFAFADPSRVVFILRNEAQQLERYCSLGDWNWLEVTWTSATVPRVVELLSDSIIWYRDEHPNIERVVAMGIENIGYFLSEIDEDVSFAVS